MSYCRWSSDNWNCDLYCYEDCHGGWTTHVAGQKKHHPDGKPCPEYVIDKGPEVFRDTYMAQQAWLDECVHKPIGLPHDGESFNDPDLESFKARLLYLRGVGYSFPDYVLEAVDEEIAAGHTNPGDEEFV